MSTGREDTSIHTRRVADKAPALRQDHKVPAVRVLTRDPRSTLPTVCCPWRPLPGCSHLGLGPWGTSTAPF